MNKKIIMLNKDASDRLIQNNEYMRQLNIRLIDEIQKARRLLEQYRYALEIERKENQVLRDIRYTYEYARQASGVFEHESPI